jgi:serine/threonine-protein kinase
MKCTKCGTELAAGTRFCGACGTQQEGAVVPRAAARKFDQTVFQGSGAPKQKVNTPAAHLATMVAPSQVRAAIAAEQKVAPAEAPTDPAADPMARQEPAADWTGDLSGRTLNNRYKVTSRIGEGGFGTVYRGEQIQMGRECALKVLHPDMAKDQQVVGRFRREAQAASLLKNAHTVQIYDFDQTPEGVLYLAMEILHGRSLHSEMHQGPISAARVVTILDGIADSLGEAHGHGIVHRDVKPENIFLEPRGGETDFVKVLDFGIAKVVGGDVGKRGPALTAVGQTLGTLEYMSPEQLMGLDLDGRSDLYAIGIMGFEMLTGHLPFVTKNSGEMITAHLKTVPAAPSKAKPELGIPPLLDAVILKLVEKDKNKRYRDTAELQADLKRVVALFDGKPVSEAPPPPAVVQAPATPPAPRPAPAPTAPVTPLAQAPKKQSTATIVLIVGVAVAVLGILAAGLALLSRDAGADEGAPVPSRMVPASMGTLIAIDFAALRSTAPPDAVAALSQALKPKLVEVGGDPAKLGKVAAGFDVSDAIVDEDKRPAVLVCDLPLAQKKADEAFKNKFGRGDKVVSSTYKGTKLRKGPRESYAFMPGDRLVITNAMEAQPVLDLGRGEGAPLVDGSAAAPICARSVAAPTTPRRRRPPTGRASCSSRRRRIRR